MNDAILEHHLSSLIQTYGTSHCYWVGFSGGLDSQVLLHLLAQLRQKLPFKVEAIHINHGLNPLASQWARICRTQCEYYQIPYHEHALKLSITHNIEAIAREARYGCLQKHLMSGDLLLTAHHQGDQAETLLLQLLRGASLKGMSSMPEVKPLGEGLHLRPLLSCAKSTLKAYAQRHQLAWIEDESNHNIQFTRNFIRAKIMPVLKERWPEVEKTLASSAKHCAEANEVLDEYMHSLLIHVAGTRPHTLSVHKLLSYSQAKQNLLLRAWIKTNGFPLPDARKMQAICQNVLRASWDSIPCVHWQAIELRRYRDDLFLMKQRSITPKLELIWQIKHERHAIPGIGLLQATVLQGQGLKHLPDIKIIILTQRQCGERIYFKGKHRRLKQLFQAWGVLPWLRSYWPLIYFEFANGERELVCVPNYALNEKYVAQGEDWGYSIQLI